MDWTPGRNDKYTIFQNEIEIYNLPKMKQEETENQNRLITTKEIETVIKNKNNFLQTKVLIGIVLQKDFTKHSKK